MLGGLLPEDEKLFVLEQRRLQLRGGPHEMKPQVGDIVHYTEIDGPGPEPIAAVITGITNEPNPELRVSLYLFTRIGAQIKISVPHANHYRSGHWNWRPRMEEHNA